MAKKYIESLNIDTRRKTTKHLISSVGEEIVPPKTNDTGRAYVRKRLDMAGRSSKLTITQYLEKLFLKNEMLACQGVPLTNPQIEHNLMQEFPNQRFRYIKNHTIPIGMFRNRFMKRALYAHQEIPVFASFRYNEEGYIVQSSNGNRYMSYFECRRFCEEKKIADPRFFTFEELQNLAIQSNKEKSEWYFCDEEEFNTIKKSIGKAPYNCLRFPDGLGTI